MKGIRLRGAPMYLDMQATTPLDPRVLDTMLPYLTEQYGNPHSRTHMYGWESEDAVEVARKQVKLAPCQTSKRMLLYAFAPLKDACMFVSILPAKYAIGQLLPRLNAVDIIIGFTQGLCPGALTSPIGRHLLDAFGVLCSMGFTERV